MSVFHDFTDVDAFTVGTIGRPWTSGQFGCVRSEGFKFHEGLDIRFKGKLIHLDLPELTNGKLVHIYGQQEVVKDLIAARLKTGGALLFEAEATRIEGAKSDKPTIHFTHEGKAQTLTCDIIAGCDGFHGICRPALPPATIRTYEREYPFGWLGILAEAAPSSEELVYTYHERGFALFSMRSPQITRLYFQVPPEEDIARWSDDAIWEEMLARMTTADGWKPNVGRILQKGVTPMRSFVAEPMRYGNLFLAGDAAHIVPPTGAKGLNLAAADVAVLAKALAHFYRDNDSTLLDRYSEICLRRVWKAQRFSWWMTSTLHRFPGESAFDYRRQLTDLDYLTSSRAAMTSLAENYVGLPFEI